MELCTNNKCLSSKPFDNLFFDKKIKSILNIFLNLENSSNFICKDCISFLNYCFSSPLFIIKSQKIELSESFKECDNIQTFWDFYGINKNLDEFCDVSNRLSS